MKGQYKFAHLFSLSPGFAPEKALLESARLDTLYGRQVDMSFDDLMGRWDWKPIRNCAGRFLLRDAASDLSLTELLGENIEVSEYSVDAAKDIVLVVRLEQGGIISYKRKDGTLLHTLNTAEGFERKLGQLGIINP